LKTIEISPVNQEGAGYIGAVLRAMKGEPQTLKQIQENSLHIKEQLKKIVLEKGLKMMTILMWGS